MVSEQKRWQFGQRLRLNRPAEFKAVFSSACRVSGRYAVILSVPNSLGHPRLGLAVSRKHAKSAVVRNRFKRQVRETFRLFQDAIGARDVVVLGRPGIEAVSKRVLRDSLERLLQELPQRCKGS